MVDELGGNGNRTPTLIDSMKIHSIGKTQLLACASPNKSLREWINNSHAQKISFNRKPSLGDFCGHESVSNLNSVVDSTLVIVLFLNSFQLLIYCLSKVNLECF